MVVLTSKKIKYSCVHLKPQINTGGEMSDSTVIAAILLSSGNINFYISDILAHIFKPEITPIWFINWNIIIDTMPPKCKFIFAIVDYLVSIICPSSKLPFDFVKTDEKTIASYVKFGCTLYKTVQMLPYQPGIDSSKSLQSNSYS